MKNKQKNKRGIKDTLSTISTVVSMYINIVKRCDESDVTTRSRDVAVRSDDVTVRSDDVTLRSRLFGRFVFLFS